MHTVYPLDQVDSGLARQMAQDYPQALIVRHPAFGSWLLFELPKGSPWTAQKMYEAMQEHHAHVRKNDVYVTPAWVNDRGAPVMRDELPRPPGSWMIGWLNRNDLWRVPGGAKQWLADIEAAEKAIETNELKQLEEANYEAAYESTLPLHMADALRGDPLAGKRKWRQTVQIDFKEDSK